VAETLATLASVEIRHGGRTILGPLDLDIQAGDFVGVVGPNGAGKSTLLRVLAGIERPRTGSGALLGYALPLSQAQARTVRQGLAFLPQQHETAPELPFTVRDVVEFGRAGLAANTRDAAAVQEAIRVMELTGFENRLYRKLSGGEQQKVQLARLWARQARLLLLDEPTSGLDPDRRERLIECVQELATGGNRTVVMVTHDLHDLPAACTRVLLLREGQLVADGTPGEILIDDTLSQLYGCRMHVERYERRFAAFSVGRAMTNGESG
jgi:iron complex transport system ATP-binding protein